MPLCKVTRGNIQQEPNEQPTNHHPESSSRSLISRAPTATLIPTVNSTVCGTDNQSLQSLEDAFSRSQVSLAITLLRSKPSSVSIEDFIKHLSDNIKLQVSVPIGERRCVDTVEYWKDEYSKLVNDKRDLEAELERLRGSSTNLAVSNACELQVVSRDDERGSVLNSRKRKADAVYSQDDSDDDGLSQTQQCRLPLTCLNLVKQAQILHKHISNPTVPAAILVNSLNATIHTISQVFERTSFDPTNCYPRFELQSPFQIATSVSNLCTEAVLHLCRDIQGRSLKDRAIYSFVKLFKSIVSYNKNLCTTLAIAEIANRKRTIPTNSHSSITNELWSRSRHLLKARSKFLASLLTCPTYNLEYSTHRSVVEGMLAVLLKRVGELVSKSVFGEEIAASKLPGHISTALATTAPNEIQQIATRLEAEQMKWILRQITMSAKSGVAKPNGNGEVNPRHLSDLIKGRVEHSGTNADAVLGIARRKVQETLLKGLFGEDGTEFRLALNIPEWNGEEEEEVVRMNVDANAEFVEAAWECVGWEILDSETRRDT